MTYFSLCAIVNSTMGKRRDRYTITGDLLVNGKSLAGMVLVDLGPCGFAGKTVSKAGEKLLKSDLTYRKFKIEDAKAARSLGLPKTLWEFSFSPQSVAVFLTKHEESNT